MCRSPEPRCLSSLRGGSLNSPSGSVLQRGDETVSCPPARGVSSRAPSAPAPKPCPAHKLLSASTVPPAPGSGRQLPRRPPLHQSPTSAPGRGHARLPPAPARPPPGARRQAGEAPAGKGVRGRVGTRTHQW
ncbi:vegetative cell wall protein gp1-like [Peromyscus leucopus]|uniref:vegetative cell wall protein gp1-like n=1 Tax=Peromyscus leucopus TaxID=10041 RepID=UPI0010A1AA51|nr:vegetative cell wall protein gp1-like [Peromyscus leucopus]